MRLILMNLKNKINFLSMELLKSAISIHVHFSHTARNIIVTSFASSVSFSVLLDLKTHASKYCAHGIIAFKQLFKFCFRHKQKSRTK